MRIKYNTVVNVCVFRSHVYLAILLVIMIAMKAMSQHIDPNIAPTPEFGPMPTNLTFEVGDTASLPCAVTNLGTKTVGWRKESEEFPLTIGEVLFEQDPRISIDHRRDSSHPNQMEWWNLIIKDLQPHHNGRYECQISATIPLKRYIQLNIRDRVVGEKKPISLSGTEYVEHNQRIKLSCNASGTVHAPDDIDWFKNGQKISSSPKNNILITKYQSLSEKSMVSELIIDRASTADAATYVCRSSNLDITSLRVHVLTSNTSNVKRGDSRGSEGIYNVHKQDSQPVVDLSPENCGLHIELNLSVLLSYLVIVVLFNL